MPYESDPGGSESDEVRFLVGDTDPDRELLSDDEVDYLLSTHGVPLRAAYHGSLALAAKYAAKANVSVGTAQLNFDSLTTRFLEVSKSLAARGGDAGVASSKVGSPVAGGVVGSYREDGSLVVLDMNVDWSNDGSSTSEELEGES